jgi:hypothetical protein
MIITTSLTFNNYKIPKNSPRNKTNQYENGVSSRTKFCTQQASHTFFT